MCRDICWFVQESTSVPMDCVLSILAGVVLVTTGATSSQPASSKNHERCSTLANSAWADEKISRGTANSPASALPRYCATQTRSRVRQSKTSTADDRTGMRIRTHRTCPAASRPNTKIVASAAGTSFVENTNLKRSTSGCREIERIGPSASVDSHDLSLRKHSGRTAYARKRRLESFSCVLWQRMARSLTEVSPFEC